MSADGEHDPVRRALSALERAERDYMAAALAAGRVATYVRREAVGRVERGEAVSGGDVASVIGAVGPFVDAITWGGERSWVRQRRFNAMWCRSPRREIRAHREIRIGERYDAILRLSPGAAHVFVPSWYPLAAVRRAIGGYGLRLGKVLRRKWYGPPGYRYLGTTWSVRGRLRLGFA